MKKVFFLILILTSSALLFAQDNGNNYHHSRQVPSNIRKSFERDNPNAGNVSWQQGNGQWHARHEDQANHHKVDTYYDENGGHLDTHRELDRKDIPQEVDRKINDQYQVRDYRATKIERPNQSEVYKLNFKQRGRSRTAYADNQGNAIQYRDHH